MKETRAHNLPPLYWYLELTAIRRKPMKLARDIAGVGIALMVAFAVPPAWGHTTDPGVTGEMDDCTCGSHVTHCASRTGRPGSSRHSRKYSNADCLRTGRSPGVYHQPGITWRAKSPTPRSRAWT